MSDRAPVVVITGAFGNLGAAVVRAFAAQGARVALIDRAAAPASPLVDEFAHHMVLADIDVTEPGAADNAMASIAERLGGIDVLVNVAGGFRWETLESGGLASWDYLYGINLRSAVAATKSALPHLLARGAGRIINVGAGAALKATAGMGAYAASKAGILRFTESLADEMKDRGITVNAVMPGTIDTPQNRADMRDADFSRWVAPEAIAAVIVFLASDASRSVTGAAIPVFGRG